MIIRDETPFDIDAIFAITRAAFENHPFSDGSEGAIIRKLRERGELVISLVAVEQSRDVLGHIAFSRATLPGVEEGLFALGPVSVRPDRQKEGIGGALIQTGLERLRRMNARGCVLVGDPAYYCRFGFEGDCGLRYQDVPSPFVQGLFWDGVTTNGGEITYPSAFSH